MSIRTGDRVKPSGETEVVGKVVDCPTNCSLYQRQPYPNFCTRIASRLQSRLASERLQNISYSLLLIRSQHTKLVSGLHQKYGEIRT